VSPSDRKFVFLFIDGGWDTGHVFTPWQEVPDAAVEPEAEVATLGGLRFVDHPARPAVRRFMETWGPRTAVINGMEVRSITHPRCREIVLRGTGELREDWPSILAARSTRAHLVPQLLLDGPSYTQRFTGDVVRIGDEGQLSALLSGEALAASDLRADPPSSGAERLSDAYVRARAVTAGGPLGDAYATALARVDALRGWDGLSLQVHDAGCERDVAADCALAFDLFERGLSRCAMLRYRGWCSKGWDTHQDLRWQSTHFEGLFSYLGTAMRDLARRSGTTGGPLEDEVTFVVFSEMGREPRLNAWGGRDHWTYTSAMLIGSGIRGGQAIGGLDPGGQGLPVDPVTGRTGAGGVGIVPEHLGATLMALADVDAGEFLDAATPLACVVDG
jgi:hypothetical protein